MAIQSLNPEPSVYADGTEVIIRNLVETDAEVVSVVSAAADQEQALRHCLQVGARAAQLVRTGVDTQLVERTFDDMQKQFTSGLTEAVKKVTSTAEELVGDEGALVAALEGWREDVAAYVEANFDGDSKTSITTRLEELVGALLDRQQRSFAQLIDPTAKGSPLAKWRDEIDAVVQREAREVKAAVVDLAERVAAKKAHDEAIERSVTKGFAYEELVHAAVAQVASPHGDAAENVGTVAGIAGNKRGDVLATIAEADTFGATETVVFETKDRRLSLAQTNRELDEAMANRGSRAAVAVFSDQSKAPTGVPFSYTGNKAIVVFDKNDPDERNLRLAYMWARWIVRRQLAERADGVDVETIEALIQEACVALGKVKQVKSCHSSARKSIDSASALVQTLADCVDDVLDRIRCELES